MDRKSNSILKPKKVRTPLSDLDFTDVTEEVPVVTIERHSSNRRVSFANSNFIKAFATDPEMNTIWDTTYEEMINSDSAHSMENDQQSSTSETQCSQNIQITKKKNLSDQNVKHVIDSIKVTNEKVLLDQEVTISNEHKKESVKKQKSKVVPTILSTSVENISDKENLYLDQDKITSVVEKENKERLKMATEVLEVEDCINQSFIQMSYFDDDDDNNIEDMQLTTNNSENVKNKMILGNDNVEFNYIVGELDHHKNVQKNKSITHSSFDKSFFVNDTNDYSIELTQAATNLRRRTSKIIEQKTKILDNNDLEITNCSTINNKTNTEDLINVTTVSSESMEFTQEINNSSINNYNDLSNKTFIGDDIVEFMQPVCTLPKKQEDNSSNKTSMNNDVEFTQVISNSPIDNCNSFGNKTSTNEDILDFTQPVCPLPKEQHYNSSNKTFTSDVEFTQVIGNSPIQNCNNLVKKTSTSSDILDFPQPVCPLPEEHHNSSNNISTNDVEFTEVISNSPIDNCNNFDNKTSTSEDVLDFTQPVCPLPKEQHHNSNNKTFTSDVEFTQVIGNSPIQNCNNLVKKTSTSSDILDFPQPVCSLPEAHHNSSNNISTNDVEFTQVIGNSPVSSCNDLVNKTSTSADIVEFAQLVCSSSKEQAHTSNNKAFTNNDNIEFTQVINNSPIDKCDDVVNKKSGGIIELTQLISNLSTENCRNLENKTSASSDLIDFTQIVNNVPTDHKLKNNMSEGNDGIKFTQTTVNLENSKKGLDACNSVNYASQRNILDQTNIEDINFNTSFMDVDENSFLDKSNTKPVIIGQNDEILNANQKCSANKASQKCDFNDFLQNTSNLENVKKEINRNAIVNYENQKDIFKSTINININSNVGKQTEWNVDSVIDQASKNSFDEDISKNKIENKQKSLNLNNVFKKDSFMEEMEISILTVNDIANPENIVEPSSKNEMSFNTFYCSSLQNKFQNRMNSEASYVDNINAIPQKIKLQNEEEINNSKYNEVMIDANFDNHSLYKSELLQTGIKINDLTCTLEMPNISLIKLPEECPILLSNSIPAISQNISASFESTSMKIEFPKKITLSEMDNSFFVNTSFTKSIHQPIINKNTTYCKEQANVSFPTFSVTDKQNSFSMDKKVPNKNLENCNSSSKNMKGQNQGDTFSIVKEDKPPIVETIGSSSKDRPINRGVKKEIFENNKSLTSNSKYIENHEINMPKIFDADFSLQSNALPEIIISDCDKEENNCILDASKCILIQTSNMKVVDNSYKESTDLMQKSEIEDGIQVQNNFKSNMESNLNNSGNNIINSEIELSKFDCNEIETTESCELETAKSSFHMNFTPYNSLIDDTRYLINYNLSIKQPKSDFSKIAMGENCSLLSPKFMALSNFSSEAFPISLDHSHANEVSKKNKNEDVIQTTSKFVSKLKRRSTENIESITVPKKMLLNCCEEFKGSNESILNISQKDIISIDIANNFESNNRNTRHQEFKESNKGESISNISLEDVVSSDIANNSKSNNKNNTHLEELKVLNERDSILNISEESILNISQENITLTDIANNSESNSNEEQNNPFKLKIQQLWNTHKDKLAKKEELEEHTNNMKTTLLKTRETFLKFKQLCSEATKELLTPYKHINFDDIKTSIDSSSESSSIEDTNDIVEEQYFQFNDNLNINLENIPTLKEKIEEKLNGNSQYWKIITLEEEKCELLILFNSIRITLEYNKDNGMVIKTNFNKCILDDSKPVALFANKLLMERFSQQVIQSAVGDKYDILTLLDYININLQKIIDMLNEFQSFEKCFCMEMNLTFKVTLQFISMPLKFQWKICVDLLDIKNVQGSVTATALIGTINEKHIKEIATCCPDGISFLKYFIDSILDHIEKLEKDQDRKIKTSKTKQT